MRTFHYLMLCERPGYSLLTDEMPIDQTYYGSDSGVDFTLVSDRVRRGAYCLAASCCDYQSILIETSSPMITARCKYVSLIVVVSFVFTPCLNSNISVMNYFDGFRRRSASNLELVIYDPTTPNDNGWKLQKASSLQCLTRSFTQPGPSIRYYLRVEWRCWWLPPCDI